MELHIQKCQSCQSRDLRNILVRSEQQLVYIQCRQCNALVARYTLAKGGYFHIGKGYESYVRSIERDGEPASARDLQRSFVEQEQDIEQEFKLLLSSLRQRYGDELP